MPQKRGVPRTPEVRAKISAGLRGRSVSEATRKKQSDSHKGIGHTPEARAKMSAVRKGVAPTAEALAARSKGIHERNVGLPPGRWIQAGYVFLGKQWGHPIANARGEVAEHRFVLYNSIGPGPHECHWNRLSECGKTALVWGSTLCSDHLNDDPQDNRPDNLVPSCRTCNAHRGRAAWAAGLREGETL